MKKLAYLAPAAALLLSSLSVFAAPTSYQVTGPILELTDATIVVQKGKDKWEIARTPETKVTGELKVGSKVTIFYTMTAEKIQAK